MKIGDQFKHSNSDSVYKLILVAYTTDVAVLMCDIPELLQYLQATVDDPQNITKEDFCNILKVSEDALKYYTDVDGSPLFPEETYNIGDIFVMTDTGDVNYRPDPDERYMLVQVNGIKALVSLTTGNYWMTGKEMGFTIKKDDLKAISGRATFEKVKQRV